MEKNKKIQKSGFAVSVVMSVFLILLSIWGNIIHEPWFDEAQAWQIAKNASWHDILFFLPHYEGHPPMWHIILRLVSYTGIPFVTAMKLIQLVIYSLTVLVLEFKSPFSPILKITLPLGFFFTYQYSVISRPYTLFMLAVLLCALYYKKRKEKPFAYMLTLLLMCLCHSYGLAFAGGLVIADIIADIIDEKNFFKACQKIISDKKRLVSYIILLAAALCIVIEIMPSKYSHAIDKSDKSIDGFLKNLYLSWMWIPSENLATSNSSYSLLQEMEYDAGLLLLSAAISSITWGILYFISKERGKALTVFIPYFCISLLLAKYSSPHHFGIFYILLIFALWICDDCRKLSIDNLKLPNEKWKPFRKLIYAILLVPVASNIWWSFCSFSAEKKYTYDASDKLAEWIVENNYQEGYTWFADFYADDTNINNSAATTLCAYLDKNIFYNMDKNLPYVTHLVPDDAEFQSDIQEMKSHGSPDFILAITSDVERASGQLEFEDEYKMVFAACGDKVFKDVDTTIIVTVYAKKGLVKHKSLTFDLE